MKRSLDREIKETYSFTVDAVNGIHTATETFAIRVGDSNDSPPIFSKDVYQCVYRIYRSRMKNLVSLGCRTLFYYVFPLY